MSAVLKKILSEAREARDGDQRFLAIFDLDSTLIDTKDRQRKILQMFAENSENVGRWPRETALLRAVELRTNDYGVLDAMERAGLSRSSDAAFFEEVQNYWRLWFFNNAHLSEDTPTKGAVEFVRAIEALDGDIMYLTARDVPRMHTGTLESLRGLGFPIDVDQTVLVLKPEQSIEDHDYKVAAIRRASRAYDSVWFFENEPVILNAVSRALPDVNLVFIDTCHSGREELHDELDQIPHFDVDLAEFANFPQR